MKLASALFTVVLATAFAAGAQQATPVRVENPNRLLTILTADDPQTQLMAMVLTMNAISAGAEAKMLLCGSAGDIALKDAPESATRGQPPMDASPQGLMRMMMKKNGLQVQTCAIYLPGKGADASILLDGVTPAQPDAMGAEVVTPGTTVFSF